MVSSLIKLIGDGAALFHDLYGEQFFAILSESTGIVLQERTWHQFLFQDTSEAYPLRSRVLVLADSELDKRLMRAHRNMTFVDVYPEDQRDVWQDQIMFHAPRYTRVVLVSTLNSAKILLSSGEIVWTFPLDQHHYQLIR